MKDPHRKKIRHFENTRHLHELTFSCYRRMPSLTNDPWRGILAASLNTACREESFDLVAFVFMPEHVHLPLISNGRAPDSIFETSSIPICRCYASPILNGFTQRVWDSIQCSTGRASGTQSLTGRVSMIESIECHWLCQCFGHHVGVIRNQRQSARLHWQSQWHTITAPPTFDLPVPTRRHNIWSGGSGGGGGFVEPRFRRASPGRGDNWVATE